MSANVNVPSAQKKRAKEQLRFHKPLWSYGVKLPHFKPEVLIFAGYRRVWSHVYAKEKFEEEWISNTTPLGISRFPRFHIVKKAGQYYIHFDLYTNERSDYGYSRHSTITAMCPPLKWERARLTKISQSNYKANYA